MAEFPSIPYAGPARSRSGSYSKRYMVVHCTANDASPAAEAAYARSRTDGVGMHFCSDPDTVLQVLESWYSTGHVGSTIGNRYGISWEFVGFLSSSSDYYRRCIDRAAPSMRLVMAKYGIAHRWLTDAQLRDGVSKGLVTHLQCSRVLGGSTHTDPGPNFPQQYLIDALNGDDMYDVSDRNMLNAAAWRLDAITAGRDDVAGGDYAGEDMWLVRAVKELVDRPPVASAPVDLPSLVAALRPVIAEESEAAVRKVLGGLDGATPDGG